MESEKKYFACPECGARYKLLFDGKRYKCKRCEKAFIVPNCIAHSKPQLKKITVEQNFWHRHKKNLILMFMGIFLVIVGSFVISQRMIPSRRGIKLYQQGKLKSARIVLAQIKKEDKKYNYAQELIGKIDNHFDQIRLEVEAEAELKRQVEIDSLLNIAGSVPYTDFKTNFDLYSRLSELDPNSEMYRNKSQNYKILYEEQRDREEKERIRLANLNNTGIWCVKHYVDDFGEPTKTKYITTKNDIEGTFSNSATQDSRLNVRFLISRANEIDIKLYEYAGNNPVKAYSSDEYTVRMQDRDHNRFYMSATNISDRLQFTKEESRKIHSALKKGGIVSFRITEDGTPTEYKFTIANADFYNNAYRKLNE